MFDWMMWTLPTAVFFVCIASLLVLMTVWEVRSPSMLRKGFLPIATTRGDRLFIGLLIAAYLNLGFLGMGEHLMQWLSLDEEPSVWISFIFSLLVLGLVIRKG